MKIKSKEFKYKNLSSLLKKANSVPYILFFFLTFFSVGAFAQNAIHGVVKDSKGELLEGVSVKLRNSSAGTSTDVQGRYSINVPNSQGTLVFSSTGFKTLEVAIANRSSVDIILETDVSKLEDVVVVGYGKQSRDKITTSVSKLDTKVLENIPYANATSALQGSIAGLRVQSLSGQPGEAPRVILRGGTSINNPNGASPLYIIDGVTRTDMNNISADDIESLQVLKDAASTAIYGSRGSNGVIIISTKSGKAGTTKISYSYDLTYSKVGHTIEYASARDYIERSRISIVETAKKNPALLSRLSLASGSGTGNDLTNNTAYTVMYLTPANQYKLNEGWESMIDPVDSTKTIIFKSTNYKDLFYQTGISHNHYITASGGSEKATYNLGVGYLTNEGISITTGYKRLTLNLNGTLQVTPKLNVTGRILYSNSISSVASNLSVQFYRAPSIPGTTKFQFEDGTYAPGQNSITGNPYYYLIGPYAPQGNNSLDNLSIALSSHWDILPGLSFDPQVSLFKTYNDNYRFQPAYAANGVGTFTTTRATSSAYSKLTQYEATGVLSYVKSISHKHNIEAKVGVSYFGRDNFGLSASGQGASTDLIPTLNSAATPTAVNGNKSMIIIEGLFSRINYDYKSKYLVSINARYDGASNLGEANRLGFFPGISAGWNVHKEKFWKMFPVNLLTLKLRASYGVNGNISGLSDFQAQGNYSVGSQYAGNAAIQSTIIPNPNLKWEQAKTSDVGFDLGIMRRVNILLDVYDRKTSDLLTNVSLPANTGYSTVLTNLGSLGNKGVEIEINAQLLSNTSPFQWNMSFTAAHTKTRILKLPYNGIENNRIGGVFVFDPSKNAYAWLGGLQEGGRVGDLFGYKQLGVYPTDADAKNGPLDLIVNTNNKSKFGGDAYFQDVDKNDTIDSRDQVYMGNIYPDWNGGFTNTFSYKNLSLFVRMDFTTGHTIWDYPRVFADGQLQGDASPTKEFLDKSWKKQGDITDVPRYIFQNAQQNIRPQSSYFEKGDFLCLREVTLSYNLPSNLLRKIKISNLRFNITGNNIHYFTKFKGLNPEEGSAMDNGHYPIPRNFIFGARLTF